MDFYKAISILGLRPNFTEKEFKIAYRKLSQEYHPDKYVGTPQYESMQKKQQEINSAREFLKNQHKIIRKPPPFNVNEYLKYKISEISKIINIKKSDLTNKDFIETTNEIEEEIIKFKNNISKINISILTKEEIDKAYDECTKNIKTKLEKLKNLHYKKNGIDTEIVKEKINYNCTLKEFYLQMQQIEKKYGKLLPTKQQITKEIQKYQYFAGYEKLKTLIDDLVEIILKKIKEDNFQNIKEHIDEMNRVIIEFFQTHHMQAKTIKGLEKEIYSTKNELIINEYKKLQNDFESRKSFYRINLEIDRIKKLLQKHEIKVKKEEEFKQNEQEINTIYKNLLDRYNMIMNDDSITKYNEFLSQVLKIFTKGYKKQKQIDFFNKFNQITFVNINDDKEILEKLIEELKQDKINIYIQKSSPYPAYCYFDEYNMILYKESFGSITYSKITQEELEREYISIEEVLESATFIGDNRKIYHTLLGEILYETEDLIIYTQSNKFRVAKKDILNDSIIINPKNESLEIYKDKQFVCEMIEKQITSIIEECKKQSTTNENTKTR